MIRIAVSEQPMMMRLFLSFFFFFLQEKKPPPKKPKNFIIFFVEHWSNDSNKYSDDEQYVRCLLNIECYNIERAWDKQTFIWIAILIGITMMQSLYVSTSVCDNMKSECQRYNTFARWEKKCAILSTIGQRFNY